MKQYLQNKYGHNRVASIGTYGTFKVKGALQALGRRVGIDNNLTRAITGRIKDDDASFTQLFMVSQKEKDLKAYIQHYSEIIEKLPLIFNQPFNSSIHAAGVIIVPESENGIYDQLPVKMVEGMIVSEWEMGYVEQAGFLKMDLLGLKQLDKFDDMIKMIKEHYDEDVDLVEIPLNDKRTYELFSNGFNEDVFQFGGRGLKQYTKDLQPNDINDLIATVALYRPGPIETQAHQKYVNRKNGIEPVIYPFGTESILKDTYGNIVYQEQVIRIVQVIGNFTMNEADDVRKAMGKKDAILMAKYKEKFVIGAVSNGCPKDEASFLWDQMEVFAGYAFNKSHATCYAITGYHCQWFKANYPLEFWTVALRQSTDDQLPYRIAELMSTASINLAAPSINKSDKTYQADVQTNTIYWTILSIKMVGDGAVDAILKERGENGDYYSIEEFAKRMKPYSKQVKRNTIVNLICAGAFDEVYNIDDERARFDILQSYYEHLGLPLSEEILSKKLWSRNQWLLKQKELCGLGEIDLRKIVMKTTLSGKIKSFKSLKEIVEMREEEMVDANKKSKRFLVAGTILKFEKRKTAAGSPYIIFELSDYQTTMSVNFWEPTHDIYGQLFTNDIIGKTVVFDCGVARWQSGNKNQLVTSERDGKKPVNFTTFTIVD